MRRGVPEDLCFRSLAAPGLDEDDLVAALAAISEEPLWGEGRPSAFAPDDGPRDPEGERRRRHEALLRRWPVPGPSWGRGALPHARKGLPDR